MKKCPKCSSVYTPETNFCLHDGAPLIGEVFSTSAIVSDETETIIKSKSFFPLPPPPPLPKVENKKTSGVVKSLLFVTLGIILGLFLLVSLIFIAASRSSQKEKEAVNFNFNNNQLTFNRHKVPNKYRKDSEFNGFVRVENGNLRSAPSSTVIDILPQNDRVNMTERSGKWYRIICEHGASGWMHGNNLDWMPGEIPF